MLILAIQPWVIRFFHCVITILSLATNNAKMLKDHFLIFIMMFSNIFKNGENTKISSHFYLTIQQLSKFESDNQKANLRSHIISPINASVCISNFYITISLSQLKN